jgi:AraC-like DNA-binding protein
MRAAVNLDAYLSDPIGQYLCGPTYIVWWLNPSLNGIVFWGWPEEEHVRTITLALEAEMAPGVAEHASVIDARYIEVVGLGAFNTMSHYLRDRREQFSRLVKRQAVLRPDGLAGAAVAGFHAVLAPSYSFKVFTEPAAALEWLGVNSDTGVIDELDEVRSRATGDSPLVRSLRLHLERSLGATLNGAARALGSSPRDLQRKLREVHTRFKLEQSSARVRVAKLLLVETDYDVKRIGLEVGCASAQHFSILFREMVGESPSQWRSRHGPNGGSP